QLIENSIHARVTVAGGDGRGQRAASRALEEVPDLLGRRWGGRAIALVQHSQIRRSEQRELLQLETAPVFGRQHEYDPVDDATREGQRLLARADRLHQD